MLGNLLKGRAAWLAAFSVLCSAHSHAQTATIPYLEVHTVASNTQAVPVEYPFQTSDADTYQVTLVDLGAAQTPSAPLASVAFALTNGSSIVGTPVMAAGSMQFTGSAGGNYVVHVVGTPGPVAGSGYIGIQVTDVTKNTVVQSYSNTLALPSGATPTNQALLNDALTVESSGSYVVTLADLQLPQALTTLTLVILIGDGTGTGTVVANTPLPAAGSATVSLQQGVDYRIFAVGEADSTVGAGLYSAVVTPSGGGAPVYTKVVPVGTVLSVQNPTLTAGTSYILSLADLAVPGALNSAHTVLTLNGQMVSQLTAAGSSPAFTAASGTYQLFAQASTTTAGSYALSITPQGGGAPALSLARAVTAPGGTMSAYSFDTTVASAGSYNFDLADFGIPNPLAALSGVVVQGGAVLGTPLKAAGTASVTAAAGPVSLLVFGQPAAGSALGGLIDVDLTPTGGAAVFATTQGVGQIFTGRQLSITTAGFYAVNVSDLGFPASLATFAVVATQGSTQLGLVYGGGAFGFTAATPGTYFINFIAQPGTAGAGTYALSVASGPVVSLNASTTSVTSGATVNLTWSSENATACSATGGWSGTQATNGTATTPAVTATTTFTLTCTGEGVSAVKSVTVTVNAPAKSGGGGGGALTHDFLLALLGVLVLRVAGNRVLRRACNADVTRPA